MKKTVMIGVIFLLALLPNVVHGELGDNPSEGSSRFLLKNQTLKIGFDPDSPPFQYIENERYVGFNIDLMNKIAEDQGLRIEYIPLPLRKSVEALQNGEIDIILGVPYSAELSEKMEFTERYLMSSVGVLIPSGSSISDLTDLQELRVALQDHTIEYDFLKNIRNIYYHTAENSKTALRILWMDRADVYVGNEVTATYLLRENGLENEYKFMNSRILPLEYSFAVQKENYQLLYLLNIGIRQLMLTDYYADIYSDWFEDFDTPLSEKLKKIRGILTFIIVVAIIIFFIGFRWNRELQHEVALKTKDLQAANISLKEQIKKTKNSDQFKEQIIQSSDRGIMTCDQYGKITTMNNVAMQMVNVQEDVTEKNVRDIPLVWEFLKDIINEALLGKKTVAKEMGIVSPEGKDGFIRFDLYPLYDVDEQITGLLLFFEDITEEKKLKDQLQEQEKSRALIQLVAGLAHEIRNPLTSIKTFVQLIPLKMNNEKFRSEISTFVPKEIDRLNQLVEGLINYAKPKSSEKKLIEMGELLKSTLFLFKRKAENKNCQFDCQIESDLWIMADESQMSQIIINLLLNAMESMEKSQQNKTDQNQPLTIHIHAFQTKEEVIVQIIDEGEGMTAEEKRKIFEPFYTSKPHGTGLGLSLSKQFILENNGSLFVDSKPGVGSIFELKFPKKESPTYDESLNY